MPAKVVADPLPPTPITPTAVANRTATANQVTSRALSPRLKTPTINSTMPAPARKISGNAGHKTGNTDVIIYQPATVMGWPAATAIS